MTSPMALNQWHHNNKYIFRRHIYLFYECIVFAMGLLNIAQLEHIHLALTLSIDANI